MQWSLVEGSPVTFPCTCVVCVKIKYVRVSQLKCQKFHIPPCWGPAAALKMDKDDPTGEMIAKGPHARDVLVTGFLAPRTPGTRL